MGITVISRTARSWRSYIDLGRELQRLSMNDLNLGFMSCGYSSQSGNDLRSAERLTSILRTCGRDAGPSYFFVVTLITVPEAIARFCERHPGVKIVTSAIDDRLNENAYMMPGIGDFGDRYFGTDIVKPRRDALVEVGPLEQLAASAVSFLGLLSPVVATVLGFVVLGQTLTAWQLVGIASILIAILAGQLSTTQRTLASTAATQPAQTAQRSSEPVAVSDPTRSTTPSV